MFWNRKTHKSPVVEPILNPLPKSADLGLDTPLRVSEPPQHQNLPDAVEEDTSQAPVSPVIAAVPNPHDAAVNEVHAKLLQVEALSAPRISDPQAAEASTSSAPQPFFDPATGAQRGFFEPIFVGGGGSCDSEQLQEETYGHLARIRELQREIATMHVKMEGVGDGSDSLDIEVDVDVDTVPTQEEEKAAKRDREFTRLPGRFKGRSDNIDAMMAKVRLVAFALPVCVAFGALMDYFRWHTAR